ncbi:DNA cytosine methyltransferase [Paenibacillus sp. GCM10012307]|uniref:DNA (cytosine-5-)-methyltransferase n=1 Tax=Paenibacillus roseus TaxID=2798579 RepID=A0A934MND1_9BACL|nr:DNA cytosine methyltransferase [Paenibacillus roseus]MBJ6359723.1 DNA cytosine methyltransferase [Paenibacillus roseus]
MQQVIKEGKVNLASAPWAMHEFFAGSGLVAYGLKGMFRPVWSNDVSSKKAAAYEKNFMSKHFVLDDIKNISGEKIPYAHLSWASFPCQDLSLAGSLGGIDAERSGLVWEWLRILQEMPERPALLLIENVTGLLSTNSGANYIKLHHALSELGYRSGAILLDASLFVPQSRPRVFVIAVKQGISIPPELCDSGPNWLHNKAAAGLGRTLPDWIWWRTDKPSKRKQNLVDVIDFNLPYDKDDVLRLIPAHHQAKLDEFNEIIATGYRRIRHAKQCLELRFDGVAGCLRTPEGGSSKQFLIVKKDGEIHARLLSPREAARLMGAPDSYILPGTNNDGYKAMGDAVALPVASFVGESFLIKLAEVIYNERLEQSLNRVSTGA